MAREITAKRHEIIGVLVLTVAVLLFICLVSYDARDPSINAISYKLRADNMAGRIGAHVSDFLLQIFGYSTYLLLFPLAILSWKLIRGHEIRFVYLRALGFFLILGCACTALQLLPDWVFTLIIRREVNFKPGGVMGIELSDLLLANLNRTGTVIVVTSAFLLGLLAATTFSLQTAFSRFAREKDPAQPGIWERISRWWQNRKSKRTVINVKSAAPAPIELTPRPAPVKPAPTPAAPDIRITPQPQPVQEGESPRREAFPDRSRRYRYVLPPVDLLNERQSHDSAVDETELMERADQLTKKCAEFDVHGSITQIHPGPVVTTFEFKPDAGVKYARITSLVDDLCLGIKAESIRIDRLPGKATVGIEVPNNTRETIMLRELIESEPYRRSISKLTLSLGKLINGNPYVTDLTRMPHLLIAGATGSGKSVALNCMITSVLYKASPEEVRLILIDPKRLELGVYSEIPHLLTPIVTDPKEAAAALRWATSEMETRYKKLARSGVRNIDQYNALIRSTGRQLSLIEPNEPEGELEKPLPYLLVVIDELADLMMVSLREVEESISRLAAMARAVGIHLILATQRPSVDVITGIIKANFPCRIAFKVATKVDSRTIIDCNGAEQLLGNGDMLFIPPGSSRVTRIHGGYVSEKETQKIVEHLRTQGRPSYDESILSYAEEEVDEAGNPIDSDVQDSLYNDAVRIVVMEKKASTSLLQRRLSIGYGRAAKLIDMMHQNNLVGPADGSKPREVLVDMDFLERLDTN